MTGLTGGEYATLLFRDGVARGHYSGPPLLWEFHGIDGAEGCDFPGSVIRVGASTYYLGRSGWRRFDGNRSRPIATEIVDRWFRDQLDLGASYRMQAIYSAKLRAILWPFPSVDGGGRPDMVLIYRIDLGERGWSYARLPADAWGYWVAPGITMDNLDTLFASLDDVEVSLDGPFFVGTPFAEVAAIDGADFKALDGAPLTGLLETPEVQLSAPYRTLVNGVYTQYMADGDGQARVSIGARDEPGAGVTWTDFQAPEPSGMVPAHSDARYHRLRLELSGAWTDAMSAHVFGQRTGLY